MRLIKDYMKNDALRHELNVLTEATFGFNFESWVTNGYFEGDYIPYSFEEDGRIISNVSANIMTFEQNGRQRNYIQIGTVMTDINYRNKGLARKLMEHVISEYEENADGIYLFANLEALEFYRKLGFEERLQYRYTLKDDVRLELQEQAVSNRKECADSSDTKTGFLALDSDDPDAKSQYIAAVRNSVPYGSFDQINKFGLQMFYTAGLDDVYYSKDLDCYVVMSVEGDTLELQNVISSEQVSLEAVIREIPMKYQRLELGFTPQKEAEHLFEAAPYDGGEDYRLFCRGRKLESIEEEKLYFPTFSHA